MRNHLRELSHPISVSLLLLFVAPSIVLPQTTIRDTITITPRAQLLNPTAVLSSTPMVDVSFSIIQGSMIPGMIIKVKMPDTLWTLYADGCSGITSQGLGSMDFGLFLEGGYIGQVLISNCDPNAGGTISYDDYVSPVPGAVSYVAVYFTLDGQNFKRTIGFFSYRKPPLPTVVITTSRNYQLAISQGNTPVIEYREEHTPDIGYPYEPTIVWTPGKFINTQDYLQALQSVDSVIIPISVTATNISGSETDYATLTVFKQKFITDFSVWLSKDTLSHSDTIAIYAQARDQQGLPIAIGDSTSISFYLDMNGEQYGSFLGYDTTTVKGLNMVYYVDAHSGKIKYIADGAIPDSTTPIEIGVVMPGFHPKGGMTTAWVSPAGCPTVVLSSDHMNLGDTINVTVKMKINDTTFVDYPAGTLFDIYITDGAQYGSLLVNGATSNVGFDSVSVPIEFVAANSLDADSVTVLISGMPVDASLAASRVANAIGKPSQTHMHKGSKNSKTFMAVAKISSCSGPIKVTIMPFLKYCQNDSSWAKIPFDKHSTIGGKTGVGCSLSCLAMVARAGGANIDPGSLANYMNDPAHYGYHGVAVKWAAIDTFAGEHGYRFDTLVGEGLRLDSTKKSVDLPNSIALSNSVMDQYLRDGALIIAEVYNSGDTHWVVVTGRQDITYSILDPACYKKIERTTLSDYENTVYRIVIYTKQ